MISWKESQEEVRKIKPDRQIALALLHMIEVRMKALEELKGRQEFASLVVEDYYEIIKEALTALMAIDGYKTLRRDFSYPLTLFRRWSRNNRG
jgi:CRISPR/Cas system-associated endonuclease Cas3-HD